MTFLLSPIALVIYLSIAAYHIARSHARRASGGDIRTLAALPSAYGTNAALSVLIPASAVLLILNLGVLLTKPESGAATLVGAAMLATAVTGFLWAIALTKRTFRARQASERWIMILLVAASGVAILTTIGIVMSMLFESQNFFSQYNWVDFFFSSTWSPNFRGDSQLGLLPLLWGTFYISFIALVVAVPIGLFPAIYLSEYAGPRMRAVAKPAIEILAGIPTIVFGLFALVSVGPLLRDYFAAPMGLGLPRACR